MQSYKKSGTHASLRSKIQLVTAAFLRALFACLANQLAWLSCHALRHLPANAMGVLRRQAALCPGCGQTGGLLEWAVCGLAAMDVSHIAYILAYVSQGVGLLYQTTDLLA